MEITLKNYEVISAIRAIEELMNEKLPSKISWNLNKNYRKLTDAIKDFSDCERKLIEQYALKDENDEVKIDENNQFKIAPKYVHEFTKEKQDLLNCEDSIDIHKIKLSGLDSIDVKATTLFNLEFMIEE
jgi:hypothetical protein